MNANGFDDARLSPRGTDAGLDVWAAGGAAQVKAHQKPVGRPDVQRLRGAVPEPLQAFFFSSGGYTPQAITFANSAKVALLIIDTDETVRPVNDLARVRAGTSAPKRASAPVFRLDPSRTRREQKRDFTKWAVAQLGTSGFGLGKAVKMVPAALAPNEAVRVVARCNRRLTKGLLVVTDQRLILLSSDASKTFGFDLGGLHRLILKRQSLSWVSAGERWKVGGLRPASVERLRVSLPIPS